MFRLHLEGGRHVDKDVDRGPVGIEQTNTRQTVIATEAIEANVR